MGSTASPEECYAICTYIEVLPCFHPGITWYDGGDCYCERRIRPHGMCEEILTGGGVNLYLFNTPGKNTVFAFFHLQLEIN